MATKIVTKNSSTASAVPTASDLVQGELAVNVADKRLFTEDNAGAIVELGTNPTTLTVTGEITANGGIALGDNDKATFGASDDLEIYHDGTNNRLTFVSANTYIQTDGTIHFTDIGNSEKHFTINDNGAVDLYYDNSKKLATTSTGIDVTGTATMDGLVVDNITIDGNEIDVSSGDLTLDVAGDIILDADGGSVFFKDAGTEFFKIRNTGSDVQIYSARPDADMKFEGVDGSVGITALRLDMSAAGAATFNSTIALGDSKQIFFGAGSDGRISFDGTDTLNITASNGSATTVNVTANNFKIGGASRLISGTANDSVVINEDSADLDFRVESADNTHMLFVDAGTNRIGVGHSSPSTILDVKSTDAVAGTFRGTTSSISYLDITNYATTAVGVGAGIEFRANTSTQERQVGFITAQYTDNTDASRDSRMDFHININGGTTRAMELGADEITVNEGGHNTDFRVESDTFSDALSVDGADGHTTIGSGRFSIGAGVARSQFISERSTPQGTNVTSIVSIGNANAMSSAAAAACTIYGSDNAGNSFIDVVHYVASQSAVVISSSTVAGSPKSRTYVVAGAVLRVTMGAGASGYAINTSAQVLQYPF